MPTSNAREAAIEEMAHKIDPMPSRERAEMLVDLFAETARLFASRNVGNILVVQQDDRDAQARENVLAFLIDRGYMPVISLKSFDEFVERWSKTHQHVHLSEFDLGNGDTSLTFTLEPDSADDPDSPSN